MHKPYRSDFEQTPPGPPTQGHHVDLLQTHQYFAQYRKDSPGSEQICQAIEAKMLQILDTITIIAKKDHN